MRVFLLFLSLCRYAIAVEPYTFTIDHQLTSEGTTVAEAVRNLVPKVLKGTEYSDLVVVDQLTMQKTVVKADKNYEVAHYYGFSAVGEDNEKFTLWIRVAPTAEKFFSNSRRTKSVYRVKLTDWRYFRNWHTGSEIIRQLKRADLFLYNNDGDLIAEGFANHPLPPANISFR